MIRAKDINERTPWQELTPGAEIYEPGTARLFNTGTWRTETPVYLRESCKQCLLCVPFCPDSAIPVQENKRQDFHYMHCKGCGICMVICPFKAITMVSGGEVR